MAKVNAPLLAFSAGEVSKDALARVDVEKLRLAAEVQVNFVPTVIGSMSLRGGLNYLTGTKSDLDCLPLPFVFGANDTAVLLLTNAVMRVLKSDALITRASVSTSVTNGDFSSSAGWTLAATSGCTADINSTVSGALYLAAVARGGLVSCLRSVTVAGGDQNVAHALRITVTRGPVVFMCGSTSGGSEYIARTTLRTGTHSLAFTPTGDFYPKFESDLRRGVIVDSITVESSGTLELPTPWATADLDYVRYAQSGDIVYVACDGVAPYQIERRSNDSWSVVAYQNDDGPFALSSTQGATLTPSVYEGNGTLTASRPLFSSSDVGRLYRLTATGQTKQAILGAAGAVSESFRNAGVGNDRLFSWVRSGTWVGTLSLERSVEGPDSGFREVGTAAANGTTAIDDTGAGSTLYNNVTVWYRIKFKSYTSGSATVSFSGTTASEDGGTTVSSGASSVTPGVCRVTAYTSATVVSIEVLAPFAEVTAAADWDAGAWGSAPGYPSAVALTQGRLAWGMADQFDASVSDDYTNFDDATEGDSGPISRTIGTAEVEIINWILPLRRPIIGCEGSEVAVRSSSFDEPLTPTNAMPDACTTQGSANLPALKVDGRGVFKSGPRVMELAYQVEVQDYVAIDLTRLNSKIAAQDFNALAVQRKPETRLHFVRDDGQDAILTREPNDQITCWTRMMTLGVIERLCVLPGSVESAVYFIVKRTINGSTKRFVEKLARRDQCVGGSLNHQADAYLSISQASSTTITGLSHLEGESVIVWGNGKSLGSYTVTGGQITGVSEAVTTAIVGLGGVTASYDSSTASATVSVGTKYNGYPAEVFANRSTGGRLRYVGTVNVGSGVVTLPNGKTATKIIVYLGYYGLFRSAKLAYGAQMGTALTQSKQAVKVGLIAHDMHPQGLKVGQTFEAMDDLPLVEEGEDVNQDEVWDSYDFPSTAIPGEWDTDARLCLLAQAPKPVTLAGVVVQVMTNER